MRICCFIVHSKDSGSAAVFISGVNLTAIVNVSQNVFGHLKLSLDSCKGYVDDMDIKLNQSYRYSGKCSN